MDNSVINIGNNISLIKRDSTLTDYRIIIIDNKISGYININKFNAYWGPSSTIDISLNENQRNKGYGYKILKKYLQYILINTDIKEITNIITDKDSETQLIRDQKIGENQEKTINARTDLTDKEKATLIDNLLIELGKSQVSHIEKNTPSRKLHEKLGFKKIENGPFVGFTIKKEEFLAHNYPYTTGEKDNEQIINLLLYKAPIVIRLNDIKDVETKQQIKSSMPIKYLEDSEIIDAAKLYNQKDMRAN